MTTANWISLLKKIGQPLARMGGGFHFHKAVNTNGCGRCGVGVECDFFW